MLTRKITLHDGLKVSQEGKSYEVTIREETLDDELIALEAGLTGVLGHRTIMMRRVKAIGPLQDPVESTVRKLSRTDWDLIERGLQKMDLDQSIAAGLHQDASEGGRDQPDAPASGDHLPD